MNCLGLKRFSFDDTYTDEKILDGKKLIQRARIVKERQLQSLSQSSRNNNNHGYIANVSSSL